MPVYLFDVGRHRWAVRCHSSDARQMRATLDRDLTTWEQTSAPGWYDRHGVRFETVAWSLEEAAAKAIARAGLRR